MGTSLPTNVDSTYADRSPGDAAHQQHHDESHEYTNTHDAAPDPHGDRAYADGKFITAAAAGAAFAGKAQEGFRAFRSSIQTLSAATQTTVVFNAENRDDGADFDPASGAWTVPTTGWYDVATAVYFAALAAAERSIVTIAVGGVDVVRLHDEKAGSAGDLSANGATPLHLTAGSVVTVRAFRGVAGNLSAGTDMTWFTAKRRH